MLILAIHPTLQPCMFLMPINYLSSKLSFCDDCSMAKAHKLPFIPSISISHAPLDILHSDVWGPAPSLSQKWISLLSPLHG